MKIENLKPGMTVYAVHKHKMGNTNISTVGLWVYEIAGVDIEKGHVCATVNGRTGMYRRNSWSKWRKEKPLLIECAMGRRRLATREEIATHKAQQKESTT